MGKLNIILHLFKKKIAETLTQEPSKMSDKKKDAKDTKEVEKEEEKDKKNEGLGLLEEDDEFEEFPADEWSAGEEDAEDVNVWEDNWDEDTVEDDFSKQLRAELERVTKSQDVEVKS